jgi:amidase
VNGDRSVGSTSSPAAVAGYPSVTVPMGAVAGLPVGLSFIGGGGRDHALIGYAFAFEHATQHRFPPSFDASVRA